jgi:phage virion morphogenesis protein
MVKLEITLDEITPGLQKASAGLSDMSPVMGEIAQYMFVRTKENFAKQRGPDNSVWAPKSPVTIANYARQGLGPGRILFKEGPLSDSIAVAWGPLSAEVSVNQPYAAMMHFGGTKGQFPSLWGDIPARPFLGFGEEEKETIGDILSDYVAGLFQ